MSDKSPKRKRNKLFFDPNVTGLDQVRNYLPSSEFTNTKGTPFFIKMRDIKTILDWTGEGGNSNSMIPVFKYWSSIKELGKPFFGQ